VSATIPPIEVARPRRARSRLPGSVRFYLAFTVVVLLLVGFEAFLTQLPFADATAFITTVPTIFFCRASSVYLGSGFMKIMNFRSTELIVSTSPAGI